MQFQPGPKNVRPEPQVHPKKIFLSPLHIKLTWKMILLMLWTIPEKPSSICICNSHTSVNPKIKARSLLFLKSGLLRRIWILMHCSRRPKTLRGERSCWQFSWRTQRTQLQDTCSHYPWSLQKYGIQHVTQTTLPSVIWIFSKQPWRGQWRAQHEETSSAYRHCIKTLPSGNHPRLPTKKTNSS